jgi:hypothetical protein
MWQAPFVRAGAVWPQGKALAPVTVCCVLCASSKTWHTAWATCEDLGACDMPEQGRLLIA